MTQYLNFDCLENICKMLNLEQQIKMLRADSAFVEVVVGIWRRRYKKIDLSEDNVDMDFLCYADEPTYVEFMSAISGSVQELRLKQQVPNQEVDWDAEDFKEKEWLQRLSCLSELTFSKVKSLQCYLEGDLINAIDIQKMFPALTRLKLYHKNNDNQICGEELDRTLKTIPSCPLLEEVYMNSELLKLILDEVLRIPRLRKLVGIHYGDKGQMLKTYLLGKIANSREGERVHTVAINFMPEQRVQKPSNVKDTIKEVFNFPNMRSFFTLAKEEDYDRAFDDGILEAALIQKSVHFGAHVEHAYRLEHYHRMAEDKTSLPENTHYDRYDFWNRYCEPQIDFYCKLIPAPD